MRFDILTIFPEIFDSYLNESIIKRARQERIIDIYTHDIRKFSLDKHHKVDDKPFGGGPGMLMTPQPLHDTIQHVRQFNSGPVIFLSPDGKQLTQRRAEKLAKRLIKQASKFKSRKTSKARRNKSPRTPQPGIILLCGRYEGIDQRIRDHFIDEELSIGKYVLTGGELPAMVVIDCIARLIPGVLGHNESHEEESFSPALKRKKEYPHYTRPANFMGHKVPDVLLSGHHEEISNWRKHKLH
jgi:tRNA (guanine37-N1)-methyltransferase